MLQITIGQGEQLAEGLKKSYIAKSILFIEQNFPDWCKDRTAKARKNYVVGMVDFAQEHNVCSELNVQKLIFWKIEYDFTIPLSEYKKYKLCQENFDENYRMEQFNQLINGNNELIKITLDSDVDELRGLHGY